MSTSHLRFTARIQGSPEIIFDLIADMPTKVLPAQGSGGSQWETAKWTHQRK